jgi:hypothetical protein
VVVTREMFRKVDLGRKDEVGGIDVARGRLATQVRDRGRVRGGEPQHAAVHPAQ